MLAAAHQVEAREFGFRRVREVRQRWRELGMYSRAEREQGSSPSTVAGPHAAVASVAGSDSISNVGGGGGGGAILEVDPHQVEAREFGFRRVREVRQRWRELGMYSRAELARLDLMRVDLEKAQPAIEDEMARLEAVRSVCAGVRDRYAQVVGEAQQRMSFDQRDMTNDGSADLK
jgi:hypothetical protein